MKQENAHKSQMKLAFIQFLSEIPSLILGIVSVWLTQSVIVCIDLMETIGNVVRAAIVTALSRKMSRDLRYEYNYGVGKIEAMTSLICDGIVMVGLVGVLVMSVMELFTPKQPSDLLIVVVGIKVISILVDSVFVAGQNTIRKQDNNRIANSSFMAAVGVLLFDVATFLSLLLVWVMRDNPISGYISPILGLIIAVYLVVAGLKRIRNSVYDLLDRTLPEKDQMKILKVLAKHADAYESFSSVKSRLLGTSILVEIFISFPQDMPYSQIKALRDSIQEELSRELENCLVHIVIA